jgi:drug/metabolite transporter (DMT)-like permease
LLIVGGTSLVGWAELSVPSGITSLILATTPLWMVLLDGASSRRVPSARVLVGVLVGLGGLAILIGPSLLSPGEGVNLLGAGALVLASLTWTTGALYSRRLPQFGSPARMTGMQMIAGGVLSMLIGIALGELDRFSFANITTTSVIAVSYLVIAGALVGFSAYLWLMRVSAPSRVATHAYVNPIVAVLLGWAVLGETVTMRTGAAMAVIVAAVVLIVSTPAPSATPAKGNGMFGAKRFISQAGGSPGARPPGNSPSAGIASCFTRCGPFGRRPRIKPTSSQSSCARTRSRAPRHQTRTGSSRRRCVSSAR